MKIYAISDLHGQLEGLDPKGMDLVLIAGDFARLNEDYCIAYEPFVFEL